MAVAGVGSVQRGSAMWSVPSPSPSVAERTPVPSRRPGRERGERVVGCAGMGISSARRYGGQISRGLVLGGVQRRACRRYHRRGWVSCCRRGRPWLRGAGAGGNELAFKSRGDPVLTFTIVRFTLTRFPFFFKTVQNRKMPTVKKAQSEINKYLLLEPPIRPAHGHRNHF